MKNNLKIILLTIASVLAILFIFALLIPLLFGYKPIYIQEYNFDLESMYYVWATIGSVATVVAIFIAILIPQRIAKKQNILIERQAKIAEQQNKIGLFDKRYEIYREFKQLKEFHSFIIRAVGNPLAKPGTDPAQALWELNCSFFLSYKNIPTSKIQNLSLPDVANFFKVESLKTTNALNEVDSLFTIEPSVSIRVKNLIAKYDNFVCTLIAFHPTLLDGHLKYKQEFIDTFDAFGIDEFIDNLKEQIKPLKL